MIELYGQIANVENAMLLTMIGIILLCVAYVAHIWKLAGITGRHFTTWEWIQVYFFGFITFILSVCSFAKLMFPERADNLLQILHMYGLLLYLTKYFQAFLLAIIRRLI